MKPVYLVETVTKDKLIHQGIFFKPRKSTKRALLWVHGLSSTVYSNTKLLNEFSEQCEKEGFGFASFNNRGHDSLTGIKKRDKRQPKEYTRISGGAGFEDFKDSALDINAGINFLVQQGFNEVVVVGHSSGANKVCYYAGTKKDSRVTGVILAGPLSDRLNKDIDREKLQKDLNHMRQLIKHGKGDELVLGYHFFPMTPRRFLSIFSPYSAEDIFDYGDKKPKLNAFSRIKKPLLIVVGEKDENLDRPVERVLSVYKEHTTSARFASAIIPNGLHSFNGKEKELVATIIDWVRLL